MLTNRELWQNALVQIELGTSQPSFKTWFKNTDIINRDASSVHVAVPSKIVKEWLMDKHYKVILSALRALDTSIHTVEFSIHRSPQPTPMGRKVPKQSIPGNTSIDIQSLYIDKRDNLNPRYTFEAFIIGPFNELAVSAARAVLENPGLTYNPFFIYGPTGRGKTHLIQAIGNQFKKTEQGKKVLYVTAEKFAVDYINAVRAGRANGFKDQYRQYDLLIMDDVQFIANTEKSQEELFHLFNTMRDNNKQIVFSSDQHPALLHNFEDRLKGRFSAGMVAEIPEPDIESRAAIIRSKVEQHGFSLTEDIVTHIAENMRGNIREIEGVVNAIVCKSQYKERIVTLPDVRILLKHIAKPNKGVSIDDVVRKVAQFYDVDEKSIYEKSRKKEVVKPRQVIMFILREEFNVSFPLIGEKMGGRDHTTVIHSCEKVREGIKTNTTLGHEVEQLRGILHT